jgi:hypothetical protein
MAAKDHFIGAWTAEKTAAAVNAAALRESRLSSPTE